MKNIILYNFRFNPKDNEYSEFEIFEEEVKQYFNQQNLDWMMSGLGGMVSIYGNLQGKTKEVDEQTKTDLLSWLRTKKLKFTVQLSNIEEYHDGMDLFRDITETVVEINNR